MANLWTTLAPLIIGSAIVPIQIIITILLLRSPGGVRTAAAWVAGMTVVRLLQGAVFGLVVSASDDSTATATDSGSTGPVVSVALLVLAVVMYVTAIRQITADEDPDAPPPKWMTMTASMGAGRAFLLGVGLLAIGPKFWVFTLGAVGAIGDAQLSRGGGIGTFLLFIVAAESIHLVVLGAALLAPQRSASVLERASGWLSDHNRIIVIVLGLVFGTWFLIKALDGLGVI